MRTLPHSFVFPEVIAPLIDTLRAQEGSGEGLEPAEIERLCKVLSETPIEINSRTIFSEEHFQPIAAGLRVVRLVRAIEGPVNLACIYLLAAMERFFKAGEKSSLAWAANLYLNAAAEFRRRHILPDVAESEVLQDLVVPPQLTSLSTAEGFARELLLGICAMYADTKKEDAELTYRLMTGGSSMQADAAISKSILLRRLLSDSNTAGGLFS